jgi:Ca2+-binding EF-hand superfamily protein
LDINNDGTVDGKEFTDGMKGLNIPGVQPQDYKKIFEAIDADSNGFLSVNEFCSFIEGAIQNRQERI